MGGTKERGFSLLAETYSHLSCNWDIPGKRSGPGGCISAHAGKHQNVFAKSGEEAPPSEDSWRYDRALARHAYPASKPA
ncbi:Hypothetical predicted protein [Marmota monax]|uniref:Uncharacterized protein n=1 Tax=Marmota monax TaxID=9995 RepID=A0A5E4BGU9_MARMO|nr:Hypothetical predicted protein [Marmota monax]